MSLEAPALVFGRALDVIDDEHVYGHLLALQLQSKLLLKGGEDIGRIVG